MLVCSGHTDAFGIFDAMYRPCVVRVIVGVGARKMSGLAHENEKYQHNALRNFITVGRSRKC